MIPHVFSVICSLQHFRPVRFLFAGSLNALFGYVIYLLGLGCRLSPEWALLFATVVGAVFNYTTTARYVFQHRHWNRMPLFLAAYALIYLVNVGGIRLLLGVGLGPVPAQVLLLPLIATVSFLLFRSIVFRGIRPQ